ncbi:DUF1214 domain-containing protein [Gordonia phthalatica]|uniref:DUF1254 domain-containing protein n=1 Tax=Gordonia phthalatica TaxID=1136941 RepID=A0A0N9MMH9_9ACTN|nr:DUF1214 domain-containing protein [Gordonia phthalatica]ALG83230.1 hypothetical protein ACH46_00285 [Gordonia phthalatica]
MDLIAKHDDLRSSPEFHRAVEVYRFFYPIVSAEAALEGHRKLGLADNRDAYLVALTPSTTAFTGNSDTPYLTMNLNLRTAGPMVVEIPAGPYMGFVNDHNYRAVQDLGLAGPDAGSGGRHLILPPGWEGTVPDGYHAVQARTFELWLLVRTVPANGQVDDALAALRLLNVYPMAEASAPPSLAFVDDQDIHNTPVPWEDNIQFWEHLHRVLSTEPPIDEYRVMYALAASLGITHDEPFAPNSSERELLEHAARAGRDALLASGYASTRAERVVWDDRHWEWLHIGGDANFETSHGMDLEARERWFSQAIGVTPKMLLRSPGVGSLYWSAYRDSAGAFLVGGKSYRLTVPLPVPAGQFWSITIYDSASRSQIRTAQGKAALRSVVELTESTGNESVDLHFGPVQPNGGADRWIQTNPGGQWFAFLRIYQPQPSAFDGSWRPGDFVETT